VQTTAEHGCNEECPNGSSVQHSSSKALLHQDTSHKVNGMEGSNVPLTEIFSNEQLPQITSGSKLETLILGDNLIGDHGGRAIGRALTSNFTLKSLSIVRTGVEELGARIISDAVIENSRSALVFLDLEGCEEIGLLGAQAVLDAQAHVRARMSGIVRQREEQLREARTGSGDDGGKAVPTLNEQTPEVVFGLPAWCTELNR
jgi:hypothetical protein